MVATGLGSTEALSRLSLKAAAFESKKKNVAGKTISSFFEIKKSEYSDYSAWLIKSAEMVKLEKIEAMMEFLGGRLYGDAFRKMVAELEDQE